MLRNVAGQLERWQPLPPRTRLVILQLCYKESINASTRFYSAWNGLALQSTPVKYHVSANNPRLPTHLPNDRRLQQNASFPSQNRFDETNEWFRTPETPETPEAPERSLDHMPASQLLQNVLGRAENVQYWKEKIAGFRSSRLSVVLLQELIRQEELERQEKLQRQEKLEFNRPKEILSLLPTEDEMHSILRNSFLVLHSREALDYYIYVLRGRDDEERCQRFLEKKFLVPQFVFNFLVRSSADFIDTDTLLAMIDSCQLYFDAAEDVPTRAKIMTRRNRDGVQEDISLKIFKIDQANFDLIMRLLVAQCLRLEPRYIVLLAEIAVRHIQRMSSRANDARILYLRQCTAFNECLDAFRPQPRLQTVQQSIPNVYFWEAQRALLTLSAGLTKPLLITRIGFRAIRDVLSGLPKNHTEVHSSTRQALGWPPYLQPGHGIDEQSDPEDNWSRTVSAGMLMQEAGYSKKPLDIAVDIMQGIATDGTPTIQQRCAIGKGRDIGVWEASIRATRNAQEAWGRFVNPPKLRLKRGSELTRGPNEYAAMFEKLILREAEPESGLLPGDKALNFSTQHEANLTEFERARLRPPSVSELYHQMKLAGVYPQGACLRILVANATSLETLHQYLADCPRNSKALRNLMADEPHPGLVRHVPLSLFAAYIRASLRLEEERGPRELIRIVRLSEIRLRGVRSRWMNFVWRIILKDLSRDHRVLMISFTDQLDLILRVSDIIETYAGLQLSSFKQFNKCIRRVLRRKANNLFNIQAAADDKVQRGMSQAVYHQGWSAVHGAIHGSDQCSATASIVGTHDSSKLATATAVLQAIGTRMKTTFWALAKREQVIQKHLEPFPVAPLERMSLRQDVVLSEHAYAYMLSLGYLGYFDEMGRFLDWLIQQWGHSDVVSALRELDELPRYADFTETLFLFRMVAEPMLSNSTVMSLVQHIADSGLNWTWPEDEAVKKYAELCDDGWICRFADLHTVASCGSDVRRKD